MADVFISYASEDRNRVKPLADALQQRGFKLWWDRSLAAGQDYTAIIERELKTAKAVIVVWTQASASSTFVRDEAGRARDEGRLVPVMLDRVDIPLGFGAFQAEDFTRWNGGANAPQMQILEEALKAKIEGRDVDGGAVAQKRRRLMSRIRIVSVLTVIALIVAIAVGGRYLFTPPPVDPRAELLRLLAEGQLTPEQAIRLAELLESDSLGAQHAMLGDSREPAAMGSPTDPAASAQQTSVSEAEFENTARQTYRETFLALARHADPQVRIAVAQMANDTTRNAAMQTLWTYAQAHPDDPLVDEIYQLCGSVGEANDLPLGQRALEAAASLTPRDTDVWRMLSRSYARVNRTAEAEATAQVSDALVAQNEGRAAEAEQQLQRVLPTLTEPQLRAPIASQLGQIAEARGDYAAVRAPGADLCRRAGARRRRPAIGARARPLGTHATGLRAAAPGAGGPRRRRTRSGAARPLPAAAARAAAHPRRTRAAAARQPRRHTAACACARADAVVSPRP